MNRLMVLWVVAASVLIAPAGLAQPAGPAQEGSPRIGIVLDGDAPRTAALLAATKNELFKLYGDSDAVIFPDGKTVVGDWSRPTAKRNVAALLVDPEVDLVWAFGRLASEAAMAVPAPAKPIVAPFVVEDPNRKALPTAAAERLSYVLWSPQIGRDFKTLLDFGSFEHVAFLGNAHHIAAFSRLESRVKADAQKLGLRLTIVPIRSTPQATVAALPADVDVVYLAPDPQRTLEFVGELATAINARKLPSFSSLGRTEVEQGILAGLGDPEDARRLARRVAINSRALLQGEPASGLARAFKLEEHLVVNMATARAIGLSLTWDLMAEADLLHARKKRVPRQLTLARVIREVLARNLDLKASEQNVLAGEHGVAEARSSLLPRLEASLTGSWIDSDRASAAQTERSMSWSTTLSQSIFDERAWSNFTVQKHLRDSRRHDARAAELDIVQAAATAYLSVLRAQTTERIQRDDLKRTRELLSLARMREKAGTGQKSEVLRWESSLASARSSLISAVAARNLSEMDLNRLLNRPLEEPFRLAEVGLEQSALWEGGKRWEAQLTSPARFKALRAFLGREAVRRAPELRSFDATMAAKDREVLSHTLAPFVPSLGLQASLSHNFLNGGAGSDGSASIPGLTEQDAFAWQVGATATLPLYEGNLRYARKRRSQAELRRLGLQRKANGLLIEQSIRAALHQAGASYRAIRLTSRSAASAKQSLDLVSDSYGRGKAGIAELIDAQNQALVAELSATSAIYDFLIDLMSVERGLGRFGFTMSEKQIAAFHRRMDSYVTKRSTP